MLIEYALLSRAILIVDVSFDHLLLELAPLTEFFVATIRVQIFYVSNWARVIVTTLVELS